MNAKTITLMLVFFAVAGILAIRLGDRPASESAVPPDVADTPILVEASPVTVGSIAESIQAVGTLQAIASIMVRPEIAGLVRRIDFTDGQHVQQSAPLIELDQEELQAQVNQAVAQEKIAQVTYDRLKRLSSQQTTIVPAQQVDEARLAFQAAAANSVLYATRLKKTVIRAPFNGTVGLRRVSAGDYLQPGQDLVNLEDLHTVHVDFKVPEVWLSKLAIGQGVHVTTDAFPGVTFEGHVTAIDPRVDSVNRTVAVRAAVPNPDGTLRPGLFATVTLVLIQQAEAPLIPEEAVMPERGKTFVFRIVEGTARLTEVTLGRRDRGVVQVLSGLQPRDRIVRTGHRKLKEGTRVRAN